MLCARLGAKLPRPTHDISALLPFASPPEAADVFAEDTALTTEAAR